MFPKTLFKQRLSWMREDPVNPFVFPFYFPKMWIIYLGPWKPSCDLDDGNNMLKDAEQKSKSVWTAHDFVEPSYQL